MLPRDSMSSQLPDLDIIRSSWFQGRDLGPPGEIEETMRDDEDMDLNPFGLSPLDSLSRNGSDLQTETQVGSTSTPTSIKDLDVSRFSMTHKRSSLVSGEGGIDNGEKVKQSQSLGREHSSITSFNSEMYHSS